MSNDFSRLQRVEEQLQRELAILIQQEIKDPRVGMVTVSHIVVTKDLAHAKVFVTFMDEDQDIKVTVDVLNKASGFLRHALSRKMLLRTVPRLRFIYDKSVARGSFLSKLIDDSVAKDQAIADDQETVEDPAFKAE